MREIVQQFAEYLESRGLRFTQVRRSILEQVFAYNDHFRVIDLLMYMRQNGHTVSNGAIYRTLPLMVKSGVLTEIIDADKQSIYEHIHLNQPHSHLICLHCDTIIEFKNAEIDALQEAICNTYNFSSVKYRNEILGYCAECQNNGPQGGFNGQ